MKRITLIELRNVKPRPQSYYYERGRQFEEYIKKLFSDERFKLKRWRRSFKVPIDTFIGDLSGPDLELIFQRGQRKPFAIECKYRSRFYDGSVGWASENQIKKYEEFQYKNGMTVLAAIGIGGSPTNPKKLFITPLDHIKKYTHVPEQYLISFDRNIRHVTTDADQLELFNSVEYILHKHQLALQSKT